jgi:hypothetical protein
MFTGTWGNEALSAIGQKRTGALHCTFLFMTQKQTSKQSEKSLFDGKTTGPRNFIGWASVDAQRAVDRGTGPAGSFL